MKFLRRKDLTPAIRVSIAISALIQKGVRGAIPRLAARYGISRQLVYFFVWTLMGRFEPDTKRSSLATKSDKVQVDRDRLVLALKLRGCCSVSDISAVLKDLGIPNNSLGKISQELKKAARKVGQRLPEGHCHIILLIDELFMAGKPLLIVLEAKSHYIMKAVVADDRTGQTWAEVLKFIKNAGYTIDQVVADCGDGLVKGCRISGLVHHPDLMHLITGFLILLCRYERQAYAAIKTEYERQQVIGSAKAKRVKQKRKRRYKRARAKAEKAIDKYEAFLYLWECLVGAFDLFNEDGTRRSRQGVESEVMAILELMEGEMGESAVTVAIKKFKRSAGGYWDYFDKAARIHEELSQMLPKDVLHEVCLGWQTQKKSRGAKNYRLKKALEKRAEEHFFLARSAEVEDIDAKIAIALDRLDDNVRSSSPLEAINSQVRDFVNSCRGQMDQDMLNLIVYFLNHKEANRGPYKGTSPWERFTGEKEAGNYLDQILELVTEAE